MKGTLLLFYVARIHGRNQKENKSSITRATRRREENS